MNTDIDLSKIAGARLKPDKFIKLVDQIFSNLMGRDDYGKYRMERANYPNIKKLIEELLPIKSYLYSNNNKISWICWEGGDQKGDAKTDIGIIEVTTAQLQNDYIKRKELSKYGGSFSAKEIKNGKTIPYVYNHDEHIQDAISLIKSAIDKKNLKEYPDQTILIIALFPDTLLYDDEATIITNCFQAEKYFSQFKEIFVVNSFTWSPLVSVSSHNQL